MAIKRKQQRSPYGDDMLLDRPAHEHHFNIADMDQVERVVYLVCYCGQAKVIDFKKIKK
jgi:hypothetical protein